MQHFKNKKCLNCKKVFYPRMGDRQKTCSQKCSHNYHQKRYRKKAIQLLGCYSNGVKSFEMGIREVRFVLYINRWGACDYTFYPK